MNKTELSVTINASFDSIIEIADEISKLQTYKMSEYDDMLLVSRDEVCEVLKRHVVVEKEGADSDD